MRVFGQDSDIHFGSEIDAPPIDWRSENIEDEDPDDELLDETPADVIAMLGFDPKD